MSIAKRYFREGVNGLGYLCIRSNVPVHVIAWENGEVDRFRDGSDNMQSVDVVGLDGDDEDLAESRVTSQPQTSGDSSSSQEPSSWAPTPGDSEAASIRSYLTLQGLEVENKQVIDALAVHGIAVNSSQVTAAKKSLQKS